MQHRGRRSAFNEQRRFVKRLVANTARNDRVRGEAVCILDKGQIVDALKQSFSSVIVGTACFEKGEIVVDSRGKGSLQIPNNSHDWRLAIDNG